ncbi:MAG: DUF1858 domain-containing protein [Bryobacterales bacterium]|nr:DUF1858 domain-containing protein [Bryobacterales bacterium]
MPLAIHPHTKVGALLEAYPGIEDALIARVPAFAKLRNPILRRTVAKVATLEQAAAVAGIPVRDLVLFLREETGEDGASQPSSDRQLHVLNNPPPNPPETPAWVAEGKVAASIDADAMLAAGHHPLGAIHQQLTSMEPGCYLKLNSSFLPAPLFDAMRASGFSVYWRQTGPEAYETLLRPRQT